MSRVSPVELLGWAALAAAAGALSAATITVLSSAGSGFIIWALLITVPVGAVIAFVSFAVGVFIGHLAKRSTVAVRLGLSILGATLAGTSMVTAAFLAVPTVQRAEWISVSAAVIFACALLVGLIVEVRCRQLATRRSRAL